jgi:hypothetical protein
LEVRRRGDGHPPFTEREREIHLNGTGGVKIYETPESKDSGVFVAVKQCQMVVEFQLLKRNR